MTNGECEAQKADKRYNLVIMMFGAIEIHGSTVVVFQYKQRCGSFSRVILSMVVCQCKTVDNVWLANENKLTVI